MDEAAKGAFNSVDVNDVPNGDDWRGMLLEIETDIQESLRILADQ